MPDLRKNIVEDFYLTPDYFEKELNTKFGSGFSIQPKFTQSAYFRFHNKSEMFDGLYFVGAGGDGTGAGDGTGGLGDGIGGGGAGAGIAGAPGSGAPVLPGGIRPPVLTLNTGPFGTVTGVNIVDAGTPFTRTPTITVLSDTGVNAVIKPRFSIVRDPIGVDPNTLIQVTDLVGLKQTGYIDGRAYYGQVFLKNGLLYAGVYETVGELVRVYDTLQESITGEVTTRPSAILRQGTDIQSNDPRLNLPGTPDNLT